MYKLLVKFPSRNRPEKFKSILDQYIGGCSGKHHVRFVITLDEDDSTMNTDDIRSFIDSHIKNGVDISYHYGNSKTKVEACNANMENEDADVILLISDDMVLQQPNYDDIIYNTFQETFPDYSGGLKFSDGIRQDALMTLPIIGWKVYEKWGYIYNPEYTSLYGDTEQTEVLMRMKKFAVSDICIAKHEWTSEPFDELHARNENAKMYEKDGAIFHSRRMNNYDL
jgi:hypothetical protein